MSQVLNIPLATEKQVKFLNTLLQEKNLAGTPYEGHSVAPDGLNVRQASEAIDFLLGHPGKKQPNKEALPGYYKYEGDFYEVCRSKQGHLYAKKLTLKTKGGSCTGHYDNLDGSFFQCGTAYPTTEQWKNLSNVEDSDMPIRDFGCLEVKIVKASWEFAPGALKNFQQWEPASLDEIKQWGKETGICMICGRLLTNPASVERGIGPICLQGF